MHQEIEEKLKTYFRNREEIIFGYIFGSYTKYKTTKLSDIDIAILVNEKNESFIKEGIMYKLNRIADIIDVFKKNEIDLVILNNSNIFLKNQIIKYGKIIFCRSKKERIKFVIKTKLEYLDTIELRKIKNYYLEKQIINNIFGKVRNNVR